MNLVPLEAQLLILAVLFYVYDSSILLFSNEGVITPSWKNWTAQTNHRGLVLLRKKLFIPNLLLPHRPIFRLHWQPESMSQASSVEWQKEKSMYGWFGLPAYGMALALFVITPITYCFFRSDPALLACLALIYLIPVGAGMLLYRHQKHLGVSTQNAWSLCLECLLCPPFTINIVRKLSLARRLQANFVDSAFQLVDAAQWERVRAELVACMDAEIEGADSQESMARLMASKDRLQGMQKR